jgi:hypothetical protein
MTSPPTHLFKLYRSVYLFPRSSLHRVLTTGFPSLLRATDIRRGMLTLLLLRVYHLKNKSNIDDKRQHVNDKSNKNDKEMK